MEIDGRVVPVTGAPAGTGRAIALRLAAEGPVVVVADVDSRAGEELAEELGSRAASVHRGPPHRYLIRCGRFRIRISRAGTPPTTALAGTSLVTTAFVPMTALSPTITPRRMQAA
jgi:NAD(P)-dependent dehydrogenase (short-subunit alcohol dehydrogenase family)